MENIFTVDLEDWYHGNLGAERYANSQGKDDRIIKLTQLILRLLNEFNNTATFFVLGDVAEKYPDLIRNVHDEGHEIASHGYCHTFVKNKSQDWFCQDISRSKILLQNIIGTEVIGYRAPYWSLGESTPWAWSALANADFLYDSSIFPFSTHLYGDRRAPQFEYDIHTSDGGNVIKEIPPAVFDTGIFRFPFSGGFFLRLLPYSIIRRCTLNTNRLRQPVVSYIHPYELDPASPTPSKNPINYFILRHNVSHTEEKIRRFFSDFSFCSISEFYKFRRRAL